MTNNKQERLQAQPSHDNLVEQIHSSGIMTLVLGRPEAMAVLLELMAVYFSVKPPVRTTGDATAAKIAKREFQQSIAKAVATELLERNPTLKGDSLAKRVLAELENRLSSVFAFPDGDLPSLRTIRRYLADS